MFNLYCLGVGARLAACLDACSLQQTLPLVLMITIHFSQLLALCSVLCKLQLIDLLYCTAELIVFHLPWPDDVCVSTSYLWALTTVYLHPVVFVLL